MSEGTIAECPTIQAHAFDFAVERVEAGWRWTAFDRFGRIAGVGVAPTKAIAAACVIQALSRT